MSYQLLYFYQLVNDLIGISEGLDINLDYRELVVSRQYDILTTRPFDSSSGGATYPSGQQASTTKIFLLGFYAKGKNRTSPRHVLCHWLVS